MEQLLKHRLVASYNKAQLFRAVVKFCGHMLSGGGTEAGTWKAAGGRPMGTSNDYHSFAGFPGVRKLLLFLRMGVCRDRGTLTGLTEGEQG